MAQVVNVNKIVSNSYTTASTSDYTGDNYLPQPTYGSHKHTIYGPTISSPNLPIPPPPVVVELPEEMADLVEMLELEPMTPIANEPIMVRIGEQYYSFTALLYAQMSFMMRLNILLVHRCLGESS